MHRMKQRIPALAAVAVALLISAAPAAADDIPWTMTGYAEPVAVSTADSAVFDNFFHSVWSIAESAWAKLVEEFATVLYVR